MSNVRIALYWEISIHLRIISFCGTYLISVTTLVYLYMGNQFRSWNVRFFATPCAVLSVGGHVPCNERTDGVGSGNDSGGSSPSIFVWCREVECNSKENEVSCYFQWRCSKDAGICSTIKLWEEACRWQLGGEKMHSGAQNRRSFRIQMWAKVLPWRRDVIHVNGRLRMHRN